MQPKLIKINSFDFVQAEWSGKNTSGYAPFGDRVLIQVDQASHKAGMIEIPQDVQERLSMAAELGLLVAAGEGAFSFNSDGTKMTGRKPQPGERVFIERYAGQLVTGVDGQKYRVMDSRCVAAIQEKE